MLEIEVRGLEKLTAALDKFPDEIKTGLAAAGQEAGEEIVDTEGLRSYPPEYHAPRPFVSDKQRRYFFAALRSGEIEVPYRRGQSPGSEKYGDQFYVESRGYNLTAVGNRASYARWLAGGGSKYMAAGGWKQLLEAARAKMGQITRIYQAWIDRIAARLGL